MASTDAAADNIDNNTIHTVLNIFILNKKDYQKQKEKNQQSKFSSFYIKNL